MTVAKEASREREKKKIYRTKQWRRLHSGYNEHVNKVIRIVWYYSMIGTDTC